MDKKGVIRISVLGIGILLVVFAFFMIFSSFFSSAMIVKDKYVIGEKVKIDLQDIKNYKIKIITPTQTLIKTGTQNSFIFKPSEIGKYKLMINYNGKSEEYYFEVVEGLNSIDSNAQTTYKNEKRGEAKIIVKINNVSANTEDLAILNKQGNREIRKKIPENWRIKEKGRIKVYLREEEKEIDFSV